MGIIIVDGKTAIKFEGSFSDFEKLVVNLGKLVKALGPESLMIETVPLPESPGIILALRYRGSLTGFGKVVEDIDQMRSTLAIDTVALPEYPKIGTWPTPELPVSPIRFTIDVYGKTK